MRRTLAVVGFSWLLTLVAAAFLGFTAAIVFLVMTAAGARLRPFWSRHFARAV